MESRFYTGGQQGSASRTSLQSSSPDSQQPAPPSTSAPPAPRTSMVNTAQIHTKQETSTSDLSSPSSPTASSLQGAFAAYVKPQRKCSIMSVFLLNSFCQVALSCVFVWLIGYLASLQMANDLTGQLRTSLMRESLAQAQSELRAPLLAQNALQYSLLQRFPDLHKRTRIDDNSGYLADFAAVAARYPTVYHFSVLNQNSLLVLWGNPVYKTISFLKPYPPQPSPTEVLYIGYPNTTFANSVDLNIYNPKAIHSTDSYNPPFTFAPDILPGDSVQDIARYLGQPVKTYPNFDTMSKRYWLGSQEIFKSGKQAGWLNPFTSSKLTDKTSYLSLTGCSVNQDPSSGALGFSVCATLGVDFMSDFLTQLPLGDNGMGFFIHYTGNIVAASQNILPTSAIHQTANGFPLQNLPDPVLQRAYQLLLEWDLIALPSNSTTLFTPPSNFTLSGDEYISEKRVTVGGDDFHIQARPLNGFSGLPFVLVIVTRDSDFNSAVRSNVITTVLLTLLVLIIAVGLSLSFAVVTTRPLTRVIQFMSLASEIVRNPSQTDQRMKFAALQTEWKRTCEPQSNNGKDSSSVSQSTNSRILDDGEVQVLTSETASPADSTSPASPGPTHSQQPIPNDKNISIELKQFQSVPHSPLDTKSQVAPHASSSSPSPRFDTPVSVTVAAADDAVQLQPSFPSILSPDSRLTNCCFRHMKFLQVREAEMLEQAFGFMITSLASIDTLELVNEAKKSFIRYIFHEVRVPFSAMVLGIEQLQLEMEALGTWVPPSVHDTICILQEQGEVVTRILNEVLTMQKIEAGATELELHHFSLRHLMKTTLHSFRNPIDEKKVQMSMNMGDLNRYLNDIFLQQPHLFPQAVHASLPFGASRDDMLTHAYVQADPFRLRQVISNFVSNAIKFIPRQGQITVNLTFTDFEASAPPTATHLKKQSTSNSSGDSSIGETQPSDTSSRSHASVIPIGSVNVYVSVADSGIGISEEDAKNLFQPYRQIASSHQQGRGTGLGLSIAKSIIKLHGGVIGVKSAPGKGSEFFFRVRLPVAAVTDLLNNSTSHTSTNADPTDNRIRETSGSDAGAARFQPKSSPTHASQQSSTPLLSTTQSSADRNTVETTQNSHANPWSQKNTPLVEYRSLFAPTDNTHNTHRGLQYQLPLIEPEDGSQSKPPSEDHKGGALEEEKEECTFHQEESEDQFIAPDSIDGSLTSSRVDAVIKAPTHSRVDSNPLAFNSLSSISSFAPANSSSTTKIETPDREPTQSPGPPIKLAGLKATPAGSLKGLRILVAEDALPNRRLLMKTLQSMQCIAVGVEDGAECCGQVLDQAQEFDCIIMDGCMPVMDGLEATRKLRDQGCRIPIIGLTGHALADDVNNFIGAGANAVFTKPISRAQLHDALIRYAFPASLENELTNSFDSALQMSISASSIESGAPSSDAKPSA